MARSLQSGLRAFANSGLGGFWADLFSLSRPLDRGDINGARAFERGKATVSQNADGALSAALTLISTLAGNDVWDRSPMGDTARVEGANHASTGSIGADASAAVEADHDHVGQGHLAGNMEQVSQDAPSGGEAPLGEPDSNDTARIQLSSVAAHAALGLIAAPMAAGPVADAFAALRETGDHGQLHGFASHLDAHGHAYSRAYAHVATPVPQTVHSVTLVQDSVILDGAAQEFTGTNALPQDLTPSLSLQSFTTEGVAVEESSAILSNALGGPVSVHAALTTDGTTVSQVESIVQDLILLSNAPPPDDSSSPVQSVTSDLPTADPAQPAVDPATQDPVPADPATTADSGVADGGMPPSADQASATADTGATDASSSPDVTAVVAQPDSSVPIVATATPTLAQLIAAAFGDDGWSNGNHSFSKLFASWDDIADVLNDFVSVAHDVHIFESHGDVYLYEGAVTSAAHQDIRVQELDSGGGHEVFLLGTKDTFHDFAHAFG